MKKRILIVLLMTLIIIFIACSGETDGGDCPSTLDTKAPIFSTTITASVDENQFSAITLSATDASAVTYSIAGADADFFNVNKTTGIVTFKVAPNYEDVHNGNYMYSFTATATDTFYNYATQSISITVLDVNPEPTIIHHGVSYDEVISPFTGKIWLDRNLGATEVCTNLNDTTCFGDYYQWGRNADGHQFSTSTTTDQQATDVNIVGHGDFITVSSNTYDWMQSTDNNGSQRATNWLKSDGSTVCPVGFRVPTIQELRAETLDIAQPVQNSTDAYNNFLKLPSSGDRNNDNGSLDFQGSLGIVWSSSVAGSDSITLSFSASDASSTSNFRAYGFSIRCLKSSPLDTQAPVFSPVSTASVKENQLSAITLSATDTSTITYSIAENDAHFFYVNENTGIVTFKVAPNYEIVHNGNYTYSFMATATDTSGNSSKQAITITILDVNNEPIVTHHGIDYEIIISPYTGKVWLDRNLGAAQACRDINDTSCFGGYYQWGRNVDGHQLHTSGTTDIQATNVNSVGHSDFIKSPSIIPDASSDWANVDSDGILRTENWSKTDGSSVCPLGYRIPTLDELKRETVDSGDAFVNSTDAYDNFLRFPSAGVRNYDGTLMYQGYLTDVWSSSATDTQALTLVVTSDGSSIANNSSRITGLSIRCIKHDPLDLQAPVFITPATASVEENQHSAIILRATDTSVVRYSISGGDADAFHVDETTGIVTFKVFPNYEDNHNGNHTYSFTAMAIDSYYNYATQSITITILDVDSEPTIIYNGVSYGEVISPYTSRVWLDRNLGATEICTNLNDVSCYGYYYQWGRNSDGHQLRTSGTTAVQATDVALVGHGDFITSADSPFDWAKLADSDGSQRTANWLKTDGSALCPIGFRIPTINELKLETVNSGATFANTTDAYNNFLKLPSAGYRNSNGLWISQDTYGVVWSNSISNSGADALYFSSSSANTSFHYRGLALSARCIKN